MIHERTGGKQIQGLHIDQEGSPLVSIVTVVFNGVATIERTIRSVLEQDWPNVEYIIVDGGSTDGTLDILRRYEDRLALWVSGKDSGIYDAMNKGIALCSGDWVGLINADDAYAEGAVRKAMTAVEGRSDINIVHGDILIRYANGHEKIKHARRSDFLLKYWEMVLNHPSFFVRRSYYAGRPFSTLFNVGGDHHWTYRAWREDKAQFLYLPTVLAHFTAGGASMTNSLGNMLREGDRMGKELGMNQLERLIGRGVRVALYWPGILKLRFNRMVAPLFKAMNS
ncbi:MAG: glycosyltransferase family 2 protein [Flavobacteriales bacterium]